MRQDLEDILYQRFPDLFCERYKSMCETCMCWGITCDDGWFDIIKSLCEQITDKISAGMMPPVAFTQVKEKTGSLRIHFRGGNSETRYLVEQVRLRSEVTCERCGIPINPDNNRCQPICPDCVIKLASKP